MILYLADSTAAWRLQRDRALDDAWGHELDNGAVGSCPPQRAEFRRSARNLDEYDAMTDVFTDLFPDVAVPKTAWSWIDTAQYRLAQRGWHQRLSVVDWLICATAVHHGLVVPHDDKDFSAAAGVLTELREHDVHRVTGGRSARRQQPKSVQRSSPSWVSSVGVMPRERATAAEAWWSGWTWAVRRVAPWVRSQAAMVCAASRA